ncbi:MAG: hypothetical protein DHS20C02_20220 [Micavibrio sp.]|nr:MAG: hypothetical protein DHS20C02_20220 [Micavibrio sp.]
MLELKKEHSISTDHGEPSNPQEAFKDIEIQFNALTETQRNFLAEIQIRSLREADLNSLSEADLNSLAKMQLNSLSEADLNFLLVGCNIAEAESGGKPDVPSQ